MNALRQFRGDLSRARENLTQGRYELGVRAGEALTRFRWNGQCGELETADGRFMGNASRRSFLAAELSENEGGARARYRQGVLRLTLPKTAPAPVRRIAIDAG